MFEDLKYERENHKQHRVLISNRDYVNQLSLAADIEKIPEVIHAISNDIGINLEQQPTQFRNYKYNIVDENTFTKEHYEYDVRQLN